MWGLQFIQPQSTGLSGLAEMLESYYKLQPKLKQFPSLQMHFSWFGLSLPEKAIDNAMKDNRKWLQACVSANGRNFEHVMWQFV